MSNDHYTKSSTFSQSNIAAKNLGPRIRRQIGVSALAGQESISKLSRQYLVSRKFIYAQKDKACIALDDAFSNNGKDPTVLYHIPVTKEWLEQSALSLILGCHSSYGGVVEFFRDILGQSISKGTIFNIVQKALSKAKKINETQDLSSIKVGAHDEIFQGQMPVLVGCDVESTYTYLLKLEEHRDTTTWGVRLLELNDQGLNLDHTIADGGKGLRSGQREAWPNVPCRGDVFHPLYEIGKLVTFLKKRAKSAVEAVEKLEAKMKKAKKKHQGTKHSRKLGCAREEAETAVRLKNDISTLAGWLKNDILSVSGPDLASRRELLNFVIEELQSREGRSSHRIKPIRHLLESQGEDLLRFVEFLDEDLQQLSYAHDVDLYLVRQAFELQAISTSENRYWERTNELYRQIGARFYPLQEAIRSLIDETVRASSIVENINSRLRNYFFLRKTLGSDYLELLQYFLNHRRFMRSSRSERIGRSPKELLTGESHDHWLELLGYELFKRSTNLDEPLVALKQAA